MKRSMRVRVRIGVGIRVLVRAVRVGADALATSGASFTGEGGAYASV